jgi:hypothetical protein
MDLQDLPVVIEKHYAPPQNIPPHNAVHRAPDHLLQMIEGDQGRRDPLESELAQPQGESTDERHPSGAGRPDRRALTGGCDAQPPCCGLVERHAAGAAVERKGESTTRELHFHEGVVSSDLERNPREGLGSRTKGCPDGRWREATDGYDENRRRRESFHDRSQGYATGPAKLRHRSSARTSIPAPYFESEALTA